MNAPPGVDTDTSGEEFTPPPSPKAETPKAEFSLTSLLPTKRLKKLRKANAKIKTQKPEQANESAVNTKPERTRTRLAKKRVRILDKAGEPDDTTDTPTLEEGTPDKALDQVLNDLPSSVMTGADSDQVIALLRDMMAKNAIEDKDEAGYSETDRMDPSTPTTPRPIDSTEPSSPDEIQLPTPIVPSFAKRRPDMLDFSSLFKTKAKGKPVPSTANPPGHQPSQTNLSISTGTSQSSTQPDLADPPKTAPSWLWTGAHDPNAGPPPQQYPPAQAPVMSPATSGYPPWLWAGPAHHLADHQHGRPATHPGAGYHDQSQPYPAYADQPQPHYPPFPPYYPHPQLLQPWQPYYPPWSAPAPHHGDQSPHDGTKKTSTPGANNDFFAKAPAWQQPDQLPSATSMGGGSNLPQPGTGKTASKPEGPKLRPQAVLMNKPVHSDAASVAESTIPEQGVHEAKPGKGATPKPADVGDPKGHVGNVIRAAGTVFTHKKTSKEEDDSNTVAQPSSTTSPSPTWTECLLSLTTCIHLGEKLLKHMETEKGSSGKPGGHFYRLLTKVMASLLTQRSVVKDMTKLVGSDHDDEISHFAKEIHTINKFFRACLHKRTHSRNDTKRLSDLHGQAARALEAGGMTHLFGQVFTLTDFLTPAVIKTVTDLLREWADDKLTAKSVMKALMLIQHEVAEVHQQQEATGAMSKDDSGGVWTLLRYVDLLYGLFVSDDDAKAADSHETIPGAWPSEPPSSRKGSSRQETTSHLDHRGHSSGSHHISSQAKDHEEVPKSSRSKVRGIAMEEPSPPSHRSPRQVMSDLVHPKRTDSRTIKEQEPTPSSKPRDKKTESGREQTTAPQIKTKPTKDSLQKALPLPDIKVEPYKKSTSATITHKTRSMTPTTPIVTSPQSSPSQYSQDEDDASSEGTVSSDEDAKSLLAQADSGPKRVAPLNIRKKSNGVDQEQVDRAKQMMSG